MSRNSTPTPKPGTVVATQGIDLALSPTGTLFKCETGHGNVYVFAIINPSENAVALMSTRGDIPEPRIFLIQGSRANHSETMWGWIGAYRRIQMYDLLGTYVETSEVLGMSVVHDIVQAQDMIDRAQAYVTRPESLREHEIAEHNVNWWIAEKFAGSSYAERIRMILKEFPNPSAKQIIIDILSHARDRRRHGQAVPIIEKQFEDHWKSRRPEYRGIAVTREDAAEIAFAYKLLAIPQQPR